MEIINAKDLVESNKYLKLIGGEITAKLIMRILKLNALNKKYAENFHKDGYKFIESIISDLNLTVELKEEELKRIPEQGPFITVSNHPYGGIDGIILLKIITSKRPDLKVITNFLLLKLEPLKDFFLPVNPFETHKTVKSSFPGLRQALNNLKEGHPLGLFPAGEVSTYNFNANKVTDKKWNNSIIKFIKTAQVPIVPVYFEGKNSTLFHLLGFIHPLLRTVRLPSEVLNKRNKNVQIRIGNPITLEEQKQFKDIDQFSRFLRAKTYALGTSLQIKKFFDTGKIKRNKIEEIIAPIPAEIIKNEITSLDKEYQLFKNKNYNVYCAPSSEIPNTLFEISRLREITFREVGEGTNRAMDLDEFDLYYYQLIIWDEKNEKIVGAYRIGKGKDILEQYGIKGFYLHTLFKISKKLQPILNESLELGRSFIVKEYQKNPISLFLLWKGILYFMLKNPEYRYLIGPVSISNEFSKFSKDLIVEFIKLNFYNNEYAKYVKPKNKYKLQVNNVVDKDILLKNTSDDINKLDAFIQELQPNYKMPILLKRYIKLNAKIIGFNIDPKFNNCIDGLIMLDVFDVPSNTIESLSKELNDQNIMERFEKNGLVSS